MAVEAGLLLGFFLEVFLGAFSQHTGEAVGWAVQRA
jgi:hypothetical protein